MGQCCCNPSVGWRRALSHLAVVAPASQCKYHCLAELCFSAAGLTDFTMDLAFGLDPSTEVASYNYLSEYQNDPMSMAGEYYKVSRHCCCKAVFVLRLASIMS